MPTSRTTSFAMLFAAALLLAAVDAQAYPINDRSTLLTAGSPSPETSMEQELISDGDYAGGYAQADQSIHAYFAMVGTEATATLLAEHAGYRDHNALGLINPDGDMIEVFSGASGAGVTIDLTLSGNDLTVGGTTAVDFGGVFGFYLENDDKDFIWFSEDALNASGALPHFLAFEEDDTVFAGFEDLNIGDHDYNDHVFKLSGIAGVMPEPTSALLFLVGGAILASHRRAIGR